MRSQEIQKSMSEDIRDMKRIGRNIKHMKGKRGYVGVMYDPNRGLSEKKIKKLYDGEVVTYNMEKVMHKDEFKYLSVDMKKLHLESWRTRYTNSEIAEQMGMANSTFANMLTRLGVSGNGKRKRRVVRKDDLNITSTDNGKIGTPKPKQEDLKGVEEVGKIIDLGNNNVAQEQETVHYKSFMTLNETIQGEKVAKRLHAIAELVNDNEEYSIELVIKRK